MEQKVTAHYTNKTPEL